MEVLYIYNDHKKIGLNLSNDLNIHFDPSSNNLKINKLNTGITEGFWGDNRIKSVVTFVGENGTGKSALISEAIVQNYHDDVFHLVVLRDVESQQLTIHSSSNYFNKIKVNLLENKLEYKSSSYKPNEGLSNFSAIYYSNNIGGNRIQSDITNDISTHHYLFQKFESNVEVIKVDSQLVKFRLGEMYRQIKFLQSNLVSKFCNPDLYTRKIRVSWDPVWNSTTFYSSIFFSPFSRSLQNYIGSYPKASQNTEISIGIILLQFLNSSIDTLPNDRLLELLSVEDEIPSVLIEKFYKNLRQGNYREFMQLVDFLTYHLDKKITVQWSSNSTLKEFGYETFVINMEQELFQEFFELSAKILGKHIEKVFFDWGLSTGEASQLAFFSRLFEFNEKVCPGSFIIVIDEGDAFFHPEWSRKFVSNVLEVVPKILWNANAIQFVFTTHSPFILSDMPGETVFYLKKEFVIPEIIRGREKTFGGNILTLLNNGFFMKNGFIGEFAKQKLESLIDYLKNPASNRSNWSKEKAKNVIDLLGDPIIKNQLTILYQSKFPIEGSGHLKKRKAEIERELKQINQQLGNEKD